MSFLQLFSFFLMFFDPEFMSGFVHFEVIYLKVRVAVSTSRSQVVGEILSILIKEVFFALVSLL